MFTYPLCPECRSEAKRSDVPYGHASRLLLGEGSEATEPYNKYDEIRPHSVRSLQFDQKVRPLSLRPEKFDLFTATHSSSASRPLGAAYIPILVSEVEQEERPSGNGDREAIVVGAGLCDGEGSVHTSHMPHIIFSLSEHILDHKGVRPKYFR